MAVAVGTRGPLGGLPPSLSDFGVVNATSYFGYEDGEPVWSLAGPCYYRRQCAASARAWRPLRLVRGDLYRQLYRNPSGRGPSRIRWDEHSG